MTSLNIPSFDEQPTDTARNYASLVSNNKLYVTPTTFDGKEYENKFQLLSLASSRNELMGPFDTQEQADDAMYRLANRSRARAGLDPIDQPRTVEQSIIANTTKEYKDRLQESRSYWVDKPRVDGTYTTQLRGADQPNTPEEIELERDKQIASRLESLRFTQFKMRMRRTRKSSGLPPMSDEELEQSYSAINRAEQMSEFNDVLRSLGKEPIPYEELETKVGFWEGVGSSAGYFGEGFLPFVGGIEESFELAGVLRAAKAINDGTATEEQRKRVEDWWVETQINALRGNNWGGTVGKIVGQLPAFGGEILLTRNVYSLGRAAARKTITEAIESIGGKAAKESLMSRAAVSVAGGVTGAVRQATFAGALSGRWTAAAFQEIMPEMSLSEDEAGELAITIDGTDMTAGNAIFRGWAAQVREYGTERLGWMVGTKGLGQLIGKFPIADQVRAWKSVIAKKWLTGGAGRTVRGFDETLKKMGWNGVLGEMFEERAGELVDVPIDAMTLGELSYAFPDFEQLSAEFVAFLVPGAFRSAAGNVGEIANYKQARRQGIDYIEKRTKQLEGQVAAAERQEVAEAEAVAEVAEPVVETAEAAPVAEVDPVVEVEQVEQVEETQDLEPGEQMTMFAPPVSETETQEVLPEAEPEVQGELDRVAEEMDRSDERGVTHRIRVVPEDRQSPATRALVEVVGRSGVRVVPVDITTEEGEVASRGGFVGSDARTVYVQEVPAGANSEQTQDVVASNVRAVVMHEVTHTLERENPSLFNALINLMPAQVQRGIEDYRAREEALGGTEISTAERDENYVKLVSEGMAMVLMSASESGSIIMTDPASRSLLEKLQAFIRRVAVKLRLPGQENAWIQNVVDQILEGKDISEITLPGQERVLERARRRGLAPQEAVSPAVGEEGDIQFAPSGLPLTIQDVSSGIESEPGTVLSEDVSSEDLVRALEGGVQFAPSGSFAKIPRVPPSFFANKKAFVYFADRMKIGRYKGIDPKSGIDIELQGGPGYPHARGNKRKAGWAFTDKGMVTRFNNKISESDGIGIVALFGFGNVRGNATFLKAWIAETKYAISSKQLDRSYAFAEMNLVREQALNTKEFKKIIDRPWVDKWKSEWTTFPQVERALKAATFEVRGTFFGWNPKKKGSNKGSKIGTDDRIAKGFPNLTEMVRLMEDPSFDGLPYGAVVSAVDFGKAPLKPTTAKKLGIKEHLSYPVVVKGNGVGVLERTVDILDVYDPGKEDRARSLRSVSTSMAVVEGSAIAEQMQKREAEGDPKFAPRPETPEQRAERLARQAAKREQERQAVQAGAPITTPERQRAARRIIKEQVDEARKEGRAAGLETGYKHAREIAEDQIQRLKDKKASVERIKGDVLKYFNRVFKGQNMESVGLRDIRKLMNSVANAKTEASLTKALDEIALVSVDLRLKEAKKKAERAIRKVKKASPLPQEYRKQLDDGVESLADARSQKPTTTLSKIKNTEDLVEGTESLLGILNEARAAKKEIILQKRMTEEEAIESIAGEIAEGKDEIPGLDEMGGMKEAKGSRRSTLWKWHQDIKSLIQSITGKIKSDLSELMVTNFRIAEDNYNARLREVLDLAESAARDAGFNSLEEAMVKLSGSQGLSLVDMIVVELGGRNVEITPAEAMHLILMDPMTRSLIDGGTPVEIKRADGSQIPASITTEEIDAIREQMDPKLVAFADRMKDILETEIKPGMFQAVRNITGAEPESVPDYWPRSRSRDSKTEMSMEDFLNGTGNAGQLMTMYLENMGVTKSRVQDKTTPIYIKSALQTFVEHVDTGLRIENLAEQVRLADKVLRNDVIAREIKRRHGIQTYRMLREYIASISGVRDAFKGGFDKAAGMVQSNAAVSYLVLNPRTWLVQLTSIPRFVTQFSIQDIAAGIAWMTQNIGNLREILSTESGYFWRRWARSSAERFGPQKYGQMVPFDKEGFARGVSNAASNLMRGNIGDAVRSWSSAVDSLQILDGFDAMVAGVAYGAARSQLQRQGVTGQELNELAANNAADAMRDTQNSTSTLDLTMGALAGRQSPLARMFLMFSSDPLKTTNIIIQASREIKEGNRLSGATKIAGVISSMLVATGLRVGYYGAMGATIAAIGGSDDDQKKAERTAKNVDNIYRGLVRELGGLTFLGPVIESAFGLISGVSGPKADLLETPVSSIIDGMYRATAGLAEAIVDLSDPEVDQAVEKLLLATVKAGNEISSAVVGNPFRPWINDALKFGDGLLVQDPVQDLRALDRFYKEVDPKDLSNQQKIYFGRVKSFLKGIRDFDSAISKQKKVYEIILQQGQEDRIESARQALMDLRRRRSELAARALSEISPSGE